MHALIVTCAHHGDDARIVHRQARSLLEAGHRVTLISPPPASTAHDPAGLVRVAIPRATGRRRLGAWRAARRAVSRHIGGADLMLFHDPELVIVLARGRWRTPLVWDVHEDYLAHAGSAVWMPRPLRPVLRLPVRAIEWWASKRCHLLLAEDAYATRLGPHPVVPNSTWVPELVAPAGRDARVVYVGRISVDRGVDELIELGRLLQGRVAVELIGQCDAEVEPLLRAAHEAGLVDWRGFMSNPAALARLEGALAGLSLLHDNPNYVVSRPTKLMEYMAHGLPVITTPLPLAKQLVDDGRAGATVSYDGAAAEAAAVVEAWIVEPEKVAAMGATGHAYVMAHHSWQSDSAAFVARLEAWASQLRRSAAKVVDDQVGARGDEPEA